MDRDEDVTVELPVVETDAPRDRVYVPPRTVPPKTKVATVELQTVQVHQEPDSRHAPTVRVPRGRKDSPMHEDAPTDRPGQLWRSHADDPLQPTDWHLDQVDSQDAVTRRLIAANVASPGVREVATQPPAPDLREAATLSPGEVGMLDGPPPVYVRARESLDAVTPRPESRITDEELQAIQSARTLEVRQIPGPLPGASGAPRRGASVALIVAGMLLGVLIVWAAVLVGRGSTRPTPFTGRATASVGTRVSAEVSNMVVAPESAQAPSFEVAPTASAEAQPPAESSIKPSSSRPAQVAPRPSVVSPRSRAIY